MDPTTLLTAILVAIGLLGADTMMNAGSVVVNIAPPPKIEGVSIDQTTLEVEFEDQLNVIARTNSVVRPIEIRPSSELGLGMALAKTAGVEGVARALEGSIGYKPDRLRFALYTEDEKLRGLVSGSHGTANFRAVMIPYQDEKLINFVQRCALWGASQLAPYTTTLYLLERHASDKNFQDVVALTTHTAALLPPTPHSFDRGLLENITGIIALFNNNKQGARDAFQRAMEAYPANPVPFLNAAFTDLEFDENQRAADRMEELVRLAPPQNKVLLATAYLTWGAALMGLKDFNQADRVLALAIEANPGSSTALHLRSEERALAGDKDGAAKYAQQAKEETTSFENYAEVAALYFQLSWGTNQPITRNEFSNPGVVTFHSGGVSH